MSPFGFGQQLVSFKHGVESIVTTIDPQMKEYIRMKNQILSSLCLYVCSLNIFN
jgi:hypothetical protein